MVWNTGTLSLKYNRINYPEWWITGEQHPQWFHFSVYQEVPRGGLGQASGNAVCGPTVWLRCQFWGCGYPSVPTNLSLSCSGQEPSPQEEEDPHVGIQCYLHAHSSLSVCGSHLVWGNDTTLVYYGKPPGEHKEKQTSKLIGKCSVY